MKRVLISSEDLIHLAGMATMGKGQDNAGKVLAILRRTAAEDDPSNGATNDMLDPDRAVQIGDGAEFDPEIEGDKLAKPE